MQPHLRKKHDLPSAQEDPPWFDHHGLGLCFIDFQSPSQVVSLVVGVSHALLCTNGASYVQPGALHIIHHPTETIFQSKLNAMSTGKRRRWQ